MIVVFLSFLLTSASACSDTVCPQLLVSTIQRGDGQCQPQCDTLDCSFDFGDCVSDSHPLPIYVSATSAAGGDGSISTPFRSLTEALLSLWAKSTVVYLMDGTHLLDSAGSPGAVGIPGNVTVKTLLCGEAEVLGCAANPAVVKLTANYTQLVVGGKLTVEGVAFDGKFPLKAGCDWCIDCPLTKPNSNGLWVDSRGNAVAEQSACDFYCASVLFTANSSSTLNLTNVSFTDVRHQPSALISATCAAIHLTNVRFANITVRKNGLNGGVIVLSSDSTLCGSFAFNGGLVELLNNGFEYSRDESTLSGFLRADNTERINVTQVVFRDCLMSRAVVHLKRFGQTTVNECFFEGNIVVEAVLYVLSNVTDTGFAPHLLIVNSGFANNFGRLTSSVLVTFQTDLQPIQVANCTFTGNFAQSFGVFDIRNYFNSDQTDVSDPVTLSTLTFDSNTSPFVLFFNSTSAVHASDLRLVSNGDSVAGLTGEHTVVLNYTLRADTVAQAIVPLPFHTPCSAVFSLTDVRGSWLCNSTFVTGLCKAGSPGITIAGESTVRGM